MASISPHLTRLPSPGAWQWAGSYYLGGPGFPQCDVVPFPDTSLQGRSENMNWQICDAAIVTLQLLTLPVSPQNTSFTFFLFPGPIPGPTQQVLISKTLLMLFLLLGISLNLAHSFQIFPSILSAIKNAATRLKFLLSYYLLSTTYGPGIIQDSLYLQYP